MSMQESWWVLSWLVSNTLVCMLIGAVAYSARRVFKRPGLAHMLWVLVLIKMLTPPIVTLPVPVDASRLGFLSPQSAADFEGIPDWRDEATMTDMGLALGAQTAETPRGHRFAAAEVLAVIWLGGGLLVAGWIAITARRLSRLIDRQGRWDEAASRVAEELSVSGHAPPVWLVDAVISPILVGTGINARIVFPAALWAQLDDRARRLLLAHEMEHWKRHDGIVRYLEAIAAAVFWWHPLIWYARRQIEDCEEDCCDLTAPQRAGEAPRQYAEAFLATLDYLSEPGRWRRSPGRRPVASTLGRLSRIEHRLRSIMAADARPKPGRLGWIVIAAMALSLPLHPSMVIDRGDDNGAAVVETDTP